MYNRYIPQPDGTYRKNSIPELTRPPQPPPGPSPPTAPPVVKKEKPAGCSYRQDHSRHGRRSASPAGITGFLKQLLPADFDTEDLMVILLLLLMAGDCQEEQNPALLTLALYLFL